MTDGQTLFAVFAALYLIECLRLVPSACRMGFGSGSSGWDLLRPWSQLYLGGGSPLLLSPLPPMQAHCLALPWLFVPGEESLRVRLSDSMSVDIIWERLSPRAVESVLHLDATTRLRLPSKALAECWRQRLTEWRDRPPEQRRAAFLKHARTTLDTSSAVKTAAAAACATRALRLVSMAHFMWCFGAMSVLYHLFGDSHAILSAAAVLLLLQFIQSWLFLRATWKNPALIPHRRWRALGIAFLPQLALRAFDVVSLASDAEPPHPLAWRGLLDEKVWLQTARQYWRQARYIPGWPRMEVLPPEAEALQKFFRQESLSEADYDPPATGALPACPRCGAEYRHGIAVCSDCAGVELRQPAAHDPAHAAAATPPSPHKSENR